jgi:transposase
MESTLPYALVPSELAPVNGKGVAPFAQQTVVLTKQAYIELTWQANYWRAQYEQLVERETALKAEVEAHQATIRDLTQRLYGTKSEKATHLKQAGVPPLVSPRKRGQQPGSPGHGRRDRATLPVVVEARDLSTAEQRCTVCGEAFRPFPAPEESTIIEVQVQAHVRRIQRQRYHKGCRCPHLPGIVTAPPAPRLIPKSPLGVSVWTEVLLDKYLYGRPTARLCQAMQHHGVPLAQGTVTDGLRKITPLFEPVVQTLRERQMGEKLFHGDETRWEVFAALEGKVGHRWYLWVTRSASVVFFHIAPSRGAAVPKDHFAKLPTDLVQAVLVCDRYSAYKSLAKDHAEIVLAYCWAHVRRDFLNAARSWPELAPWMWKWIEDIRTLYRLNTARLAVWEATVPFDHQAPAFVARHHDLTTHLGEMQDRCEMYRRERSLHQAQRPILESLHNHWGGLTVFLTRPEVALDNNSAERALRTPVVGRKNYYGSGSLWSAHLAAMIFSVLQTLLVWGLNPRHWLSAFFHACVAHGGKTPPDLSTFLPWQMTDERKHQLAQPLPVQRSPWDSLPPERDPPVVANTS